MGFVGEIRLAAFSVVPSGWAVCNGQTLAISQNERLFNVIGTTYGGDGQSTFKLPDLQGRVPLHATSALPLGVTGGTEVVTLTAAQIPPHTHILYGTSAPATTPNPAGAVPAAAPATLGDVYAQSSSADVQMAASASGGSAPSSPHANVQPFLVINYIICVQGIIAEKS